MTIAGGGDEAAAQQEGEGAHQGTQRGQGKGILLYGETYPYN